MVQESTLAEALAEFARTMVTDFPIQSILDRLVERIVDILPITGAGVTLIDPGLSPRYLAASNASALRYEQLQAAVGQGPCVAAYLSGEAVALPDLAASHDFPQFVPAAVAAGLAAVFTFPLRHGSGRLGALDLYRDTTGDLDLADMEAAQTLADVAAAYLINAEAREEARHNSDIFRNGALHDTLTGLPNRLLFQERLDHAAQRAHRSHTNSAVLFVDLDDFKQVNDTYGHHVGDQLLVAVAQRLTGLVRPGDTLARLSGDEFVFLCEDLYSAKDVEALALRITQGVAHPFALKEVTLDITASVGVAFAGPGDEISSRLVVDADIAMYQAKRRRGTAPKDSVIDLRAEGASDSFRDLERDLRSALVLNELDVAYQPIVRNHDGVVVGVEALVRWTHPTRGLVSPLLLIGTAEETGLIHELGGWVLERSCRDRARWLAAFPDTPLDVAVNVSPRQLVGADLSSTVGALLEQTGMDPAALVLEITESSMIMDSERALAIMVDLKSLGARLALDDFGTGFSSLSHLQRLPIDVLKIDQSFIADIGYGTTGGAIVAAVTDLAHVFGLGVTAEGIETKAQAQVVRDLGCEFGQGFFYSPPIPARAIESMLRARATNPSYDIRQAAAAS